MKEINECTIARKRTASDIFGKIIHTPDENIYNYWYALHEDVSVNDGPHIRRWSHNIIILY